MKLEHKNLAASVHDRLLNRSREREEDFSFVLHRYAAERFLYRLGLSTYREQLVLKGAMLFAVWGGSAYRPTRDLDFTGYGDSEAAAVLTCFREICDVDVPDDALVFDSTTLTLEQIRDDAEYDGLRIRVSVTLGSARIPLQIDVGFGNAIEPSPNNVEYPTLLDGPAPCIRAYPHEAVIAEKFHCMVRFGERNSRLKDFYDLYVLAHEFQFASEQLTSAIAATFKRRNTAIAPAQPVALAPRFYADTARATQWRTYLERNHLPGAPADFDSVGELIRQFLGPVWTALAENTTFASKWSARGPWNSENSKKEISTAMPASPGLSSYGQQHSQNSDTALIVDIEIPIATSLRRFKPYPAYKDCGVEWLGKIPVHWEVKKLAWLTQCLDSRRVPLNAEERGHMQGDYPYWGANSIVDYVDQWLFDEELVLLGEDGAPFFDRSKPVAFRVDGKIWVNNHTHVLRPGRVVEGSFLAYALNCVDYRAFIDGSTRDKLTQSDMNRIPVQCPQLAEQRDIAAFLDRETAKIDALVAKKERLIELLQEKRAALITRAVTKGLDPNVPMKDSAVEWLGQIPAHWEVERIKWAARMESGHTPDKKVDSYWQGGDIPWVSLADTGQLREMDYIVDTAVRTTSDGIAHSSAHILPSDTVVFSRDATIGLCAVTRAEMAVSQHFIGWVCSQRLKPDYLLFVLRSMTQELERLTMGATVRTIGMPDVKSLVTPVPPLQEQAQIVEYARAQRTHIDALLAKIQEGIDRLKELRTALISAVVTGKIDVREEMGA